MNPVNRRKFLQNSLLATAGAWLTPAFLQHLQAQSRYLKQDDNILLIIQLNGGNDGLNTVIPVGNDIYQKQRRGIAIADSSMHTLNDSAALHPSLKEFKTLYDAGELAIMNSVGYPYPNRSHFRSLDIWQTASGASEYLSNGWLGRYLDSLEPGIGTPIHALEIDDVLSLALKGEVHNGMAIREPARLKNTSEAAVIQLLKQQHRDEHEHGLAGYLYRTLDATLQSAEDIFRAAKVAKHKAEYPATNLGRQFNTVASLIRGGITTRVYYLNHGSFDTHVNQPLRHTNLLQQLDSAVGAFAKDMKDAGKWKNILVVTFSEFGRRVAQNGSNGTDHGTANQMFFLGGGLKRQGILNGMPDLADLDNGDLKWQVDFRTVYATILENWLHADASKILGRSFDFHDFI